MTTIYHGNKRKIHKLDPRFMLHERSDNWFGIGIYFTSDIRSTKPYGKWVVSAKTGQLNIAHHETDLGGEMSRNQLKEFYDYLLEVCVSEYRKKDFQREFLSHNWWPFEIGIWQKELALFIGKENIVDFVEGWNAIIKIDGLYTDIESKLDLGIEEDYDEYCIINPKVKIKPVNF